MVKICENKNKCKSAYSKNGNNKWSRKVSDEEKKKNRMESIRRWQNIEYICPKCDKKTKNYYKSLHNKNIVNTNKSD